MKKVIISTIFFLSSFVMYAQQNSTLWIKVQQIRTEKFPETANIWFGTIIPASGKSPGYPATPSVCIDDKRIFSNEGLNALSLSDMAGADYINKDDTQERKIFASAVYGSSAANGIILIYTKAYALAHPNIVSTFKYVFP